MSRVEQLKMLVNEITGAFLGIIGDDGVENMVPTVLLDASGHTIGIKDHKGQSIATGSSGATSVAYSTTIPLSTGGPVVMTPHVVSGAITLIPSSTKVIGSYCSLRLIADGSHVPDVTAFKQAGGSGDYSNVTGITNEFYFWYDGSDVVYSVNQFVGAVPVATAVTLGSHPTSGVINTASTNFPLTIAGDFSGTINVSYSCAGGTFSQSSLAFTSPGTQNMQFTPNGTVQTDVIVFSNDGGLTNPANVNYSAIASPVAPDAPTQGTVTAGDTTASVPITVGFDGGAAITSTVAEAYIAGVATGITGSLAGAGSGTINVTGLTDGTTYTFKSHSINSQGPGALSTASNSVTPAAVNPRLGNLSLLTESGSGPYVYTGASGNIFTGTSGGVSTKKSPSGGTTTFDIKIPASATGFMAGVSTSATPNDYPNWVAGTYFSGGAGTAYQHLGTGSFTDALAGVVYAANDILRFSITNTTVTLSRALAGSPTTFVLMFTWTVTAADYYIQARVDGSTVIDPVAFSGFV